jgi:hypothetical protein
VDDQPRIAVQSDDGTQWFDFHFDCATDPRIAAARRGGPIPMTILEES